MMTFVKTMLLIVNITAFVFSSFCGVFYMVYQIFGFPAARRLLEWLHIPLSYNQVLCIGFICIAIVIVTGFVIAKLFGK